MPQAQSSAAEQAHSRDAYRVQRHGVVLLNGQGDWAVDHRVRLTSRAIQLQGGIEGPAPGGMTRSRQAFRSLELTVDRFARRSSAPSDRLWWASRGPPALRGAFRETPGSSNGPWSTPHPSSRWESIVIESSDSIRTGQASDDQIAAWRDQGVDQLISNGTIVSQAVADAMRKVPRHLFIPEVSLEDAYEPFRAVVTKKSEEGSALSSVSDMHVQAFMLEQAAITPGMNVLEIGSGGYNAALICELVGPSGRVTTVDIDPYVTDRASRMLDEAGYSRATVVLADAEDGVPAYAPYDRILVTMGAWDVPPAWSAQLAEGGRLTTALRIRGLHRVITFEQADGYLVSTASKMFGFVAVQGAGAHQAKLLVMRDGEITLRFDDGTDLDPAVFEGVFQTDRVEVWSGALIGVGEFLDTVQMWMATAFPGFCMVLVDQDRDTGVVAPRNASSAMAVVDEAGNLAYLTTRSATEDGQKAVEYGVHAYGPDAADLAESVAEQLRVWSREHRKGPGAQYWIYPAGTPDDLLPRGRVIEKAHSRVSISWPQAANAVAGQRVSASPID